MTKQKRKYKPFKVNFMDILYYPNIEYLIKLNNHVICFNINLYSENRSFMCNKLNVYLYYTL